MSITIVSAWTEEIEWFARKANETKRRYAKKHGYQFACLKGNLSGDKWPHWSKVSLILAAMDCCDWVFWSDADSFILNMEPKLEDYVDEQFDLIVSNHVIEPNRFSFNTGNIFVKSSDWSRKFWRSVLDKHPGHCDEQLVVNDMWNKSEEVKKRTKVIPKADFNVLWDVQPGRPVSPHVMRFILHFAGTQRYIPWLFGRWKDDKLAQCKND